MNVFGSDLIIFGVTTIIPRACPSLVMAARQSRLHLVTISRNTFSSIPAPFLASQAVIFLTIINSNSALNPIHLPKSLFSPETFTRLRFGVRQYMYLGKTLG